MYTNKFSKNLMVFGVVAILSLPLLDTSFSLRANTDCGNAEIINNSSPVDALSASDDLNGGWWRWKIWSWFGGIDPCSSPPYLIMGCNNDVWGFAKPQLMQELN